MTILDYNRVVKDLNGRSAGRSCSPSCAKSFTVTAVRRAGAPGVLAASSACISPAAGTG